MMKKSAVAVLAVGCMLCTVATMMTTLVGGTLGYLLTQTQATDSASLAPTARLVAPSATAIPALPKPTSPGATDDRSATPYVPTAQSPALVETRIRPTATLQATATAAPVSRETTLRQARIFDKLWNAVNDKYVYPDFHGVDWLAARQRINSLINTGISDAAFYDAMHALIDGLKDDHSHFESPSESNADDSRRTGSGSYVGIGITTDVNDAQHYVYILQVKPGSPAEKAGLLPHDHFVEIEGSPSVDASGMPAIQKLRGPDGETVTVKVQTPGQPSRTVTIQRGQVKNGATVEYRMLPGEKKIGYIFLPTFAEDNIQQKVRDALRSLMKSGGGMLDGLIVDVRLNGGGQFRELSGIEGMFAKGRLGRLATRSNATTSQFTVRAESIGNSQTVPLIVLTSRSTASAAEVFAGSLQAAGRAKLGGAKSSGNIEALFSIPFEDGSVLWLAEEAFQLQDGRSWEGVGLIPDVPVTAEWDEFTGNADPVIDAAARELSR